MGWAYALGLIACSGQLTDEPSTGNDADLQGAGGPEGSASGEAVAFEAALRSGGNCERLLQSFQAQLLDQVRERAEQARQGQGNYYGYPVAPTPVAPSAPQGDASNPLLAGGATSSGGFSETTVQVPGVDEADFVKAEGDHIYLLHGPSLYVLGAASAESTEIQGTVAIEGNPIELFARGDEVVVFSSYYGALPGTDQSTNPYNYYYYPTYTKLTVVDVASGVPQVVRESYVEGNYASSRRHDGIVRAILQQTSKAQLDYPNVSYVDFLGHPYSQTEIDRQVELWVSLATATIEDSVIEDYVPSELERVDGALVKKPLRCGDYWLPAPGLTQSGASTILALDLDDVDAGLRRTTVLGYADRVYANDSAVVITQTDYRYYTGQQTSLQTNIHRFDIVGADTRYAATGTFTGSIQSQFSLDEQDGVIRVAATESNWGVAVPVPLEDGIGGGVAVPAPPAGPVSRVLTLGQRGQRLVELGHSADFGANEQVYATRFLGDRAYVVTFRQIDPLFVIDLADPTEPKIAGELQLPGFSNFLYPLPDHHLLAIGQDADASGGVQGMALQIFDVRDASAPRLAHKYVLSEQGYSEASSDHRAITFHPDQNLVAFPFQSYNGGESTLEVFRVSTSDGFTRLGGIQPRARELSPRECLALYGYPDDPAFLEEVVTHPDDYSYLFEECRYYAQPRLQRGLFRGDDVYTVTTLDVSAYSLDGLAGPALSSAALPPIDPYSYYPYPGGGGIAGAAGSAASFGMPDSGVPGAAGSAAMTGSGGAGFE
jgi:hypothetical protein